VEVKKCFYLIKSNVPRKGFNDFLAYQKGFELAMEIFESSKSFPKKRNGFFYKKK
jgi:hypothetical protein